MDKKNAEKINLGTDSQVEEVRQRIKDIVPQAFTDDVLNIELLQQILGASENDGSRYQLDWSGKDDAFRALQIPSYATLHPDKASIKFDSAENVFIEGDNLEVLKLLQRAYNDKVKLIYIDPPYNTTKDFVYNDDFTDSLDTYLKYTGQRDSDGKMTSATTESGGRRHSGWLSMMMPRLSLARNLLRRDGIIFVSIDDNEVHNLRHAMDMIFGQNNFIASVIWDMGVSQQAGQFSEYHQYVLVYARDKQTLTNFKSEGDEKIDDRAIKKISKANPASDYVFRAGIRCDAPNGTKLTGIWGGEEKIELVAGKFEVRDGKTAHEMTLRAGWAMKDKMNEWLTGTETVYDTRGQVIEEFYFNSTGIVRCRKKKGVVTPPTVQRWGAQSRATKELLDLMKVDVFDSPKPIQMLCDIVSWATSGDDIVLDFFAGSGTTGHAVMAQNKSDGGSRKFVLVNLPENVDFEKKPDAKRAGVKTVADVTRLRLKKAAASVGVKDYALKSFTLGESNFKIWSPDAVGESEEEIARALQLFSDSLVNGATDDSIAAELLLKEGISLSQPWQRMKIADSDVVRVGSVAVALTRAVTEKFITEVLKVDWLEKLLMLDAAFDGQDKHKSNLLLGADEAGVIVRVA